MSVILSLMRLKGQLWNIRVLFWFVIELLQKYIFSLVLVNQNNTKMLGKAVRRFPISIDEFIDLDKVTQVIAIPLLFGAVQIIRKKT